MSTIAKEQVQHIAKLARLQLTDMEEPARTTGVVQSGGEKMTEELGAILHYIDKLGEVDTTGVEPTAQVTGLSNIMRKDVVVEQLGNPADLIAAAPDREGEFIKVKEVFTK